MPAYDLIATSAFGLERVVQRELADLGYEAKPYETGRIAFRGDASAVCRANLWLRCADRVLVRVDEFECRDFDTLFERTKAISWSDLIPTGSKVLVKGRSVRSSLSSVPACQRTVKKAIVSSLVGEGMLEETGAPVTVEISLLKDAATLTIDTSGRGLHRRGYRELSAGAQLRETLAAALVLLSPWKPGRPFHDPFCGSGTIPIEAAMIARRLAPGRHRTFAGEDLPWLDAWDEAQDEAESVALPPLEDRLLATDIDDSMLSLARHHASKAEVESDIHFQQMDVRALRSKRQSGCTISNPPYGERLGELDEAEAIYRDLPGVYARLPSWSHVVLTSHPRFESIIGRQADKRRKVYNGRIECTLYTFFGPRPQETKAAPAFGGLDEKADRQAEMFAVRLSKRARHLRKWPDRGISCYRLYERDVPEVPLVVDRYDDCLHIAEYERPHDRDPGQHAAWLELMAKTAAEVMEMHPSHVFLKKRGRQRGAAQYERVSDRHVTRTVSEHGLRFEVNLSDYVDTGLFLDHRQTRAMVRERSSGARVLNLFCYTGSFSVYAAAGGARSTTSVDLSNTYLDWAARNMALNGFEGDAHRYVHDDVLAFLDRDRTRYDLVIADPPTFSNSKRTEIDWDVQRDHGHLLELALRRLAPGGEIVFSTNFRRFRMDEIEAEVREISGRTVPEDFRNKRIHRCFLVRHPRVEEPEVTSSPDLPAGD